MGAAMTEAGSFPPVAVSARGLACRVGERLLFENLSFSVSPGEALLLRGPNGAGKTSLLRVVAGLLRADAGEVELNGLDPEARRETTMHWLGHRTAAKARLSVRENLAGWMAAFGANGGAEAALERVGLGELAHLPAGYLSAGQARRLALALLVAVRRPLWLLDEPTAALDAAGDQLVGELVDEQLATGGLALVATHLPIAMRGRVRELQLGLSP